MRRRSVVAGAILVALLFTAPAAPVPMTSAGDAAVGATPPDRSTPLQTWLAAMDGPGMAAGAASDPGVDPEELVSEYIRRSAAADVPLRDALLDWADALDVPATEDIHGAIADSEGLPRPVQEAVAVLLFAMSDATRSQEKAVGGTSPQQLESLLEALRGLGGTGLQGDQMEVAEEVMRQVDLGLLRSARDVVVAATAHALPVLEKWSAERPVGQSTLPGDVERLLADDGAGLGRLLSIYQLAAQWSGHSLPSDVSPVRPDAERPVEAGLESLAGAHGIPLDGPTLQRAFADAAGLPDSLAWAVGLLLENQASLVQAANVGSADGLATVAAQYRMIAAVREVEPTLQAWALVLSHRPAEPLVPDDVTPLLAGTTAAAMAVTRSEDPLQAFLELSAGLRGLPAPAAPHPPLPPRGDLAAAVMELYGRAGHDVPDHVEESLVRSALSLPAVVEQNTARLMRAHLSAWQTMQDGIDDLSPEEIRALADPVDATHVLRGPVTADGLDRLRTQVEAQDRIATAYLEAAATVSAAMTASEAALAEWVDPPRPEENWFLRLLGAVLPPNAQAQEGPDVSCPDQAPFSRCSQDIWFVDPLLETVVVTGTGSTTLDPRDLGTGISFSDEDLHDPREETAVRPRGQVLSLDLGGNDVYRNNAGGAFPVVSAPLFATPHPNEESDLTSPWRIVDPVAVAIALDLGGQDLYTTPPSGYPAAAIQGAAIGGIGILWDREGDDIYRGVDVAQGAAAGRHSGAPREDVECTPNAASSNGNLDTRCPPLPAGVGILIDGAGQDRYEAATQAQGYGGGFRVEAVGSAVSSVLYLGGLLDLDGDDVYTLPTIGSPHPGQGEGDDGMGFLLDASGNDQYRNGGQGEATRVGLGVLADLGGFDTYTREPDPPVSYEDRVCAMRSADPTTRITEETTPEAIADLLANPFLLQGFATPYATTANGPRAAFFIDTSATAPCTLYAAGEEVAPEDVERLVEDAQTDSDGDGHSDLVEKLAGTDPDGPDGDKDYPAGRPAAADGVPIPSGAPYLIRVPLFLGVGDVVDTPWHGTYRVQIDLGGNDTYRGGAGSVLSTAIDLSGDDVYLPIESEPADSRPVDLRALALDPVATQGSSGLLLDLAGNDTYQAADRSQGFTGGPWSAVPGVLFDASGDDTYRVEPGGTGQGAIDNALPVPTLAMLVDLDGTDRYSSDGQGHQGGVSLGTALFLDLAGDDTYDPVGDQAGAPDTLDVATVEQVVTPGGVSAFIDGDGTDRYIGVAGQATRIDRSDARNDRLSVHANARGSQSLFWDASQGGSPSTAPSLSVPALGVLVSGEGDDVHTRDLALLVERGGNDAYANNAGSTLFRDSRLDAAATSGEINNIFPPCPCVDYEQGVVRPVAAVLIDLEGDDTYTSPGSASSLRNVGSLTPTSTTVSPALVDGPLEEVTMQRFDPSRGGHISQGTGLLGVGVLVDQGGDDSYTADGFSQGHGIAGHGILWDRAGDDHYGHDPVVTSDLDMEGSLVAWRARVDGHWTLQAAHLGGDCVVDLVSTTDFSDAGPPSVQGKRIHYSVLDRDDRRWRAVSTGIIGGCGDLESNAASNGHSGLSTTVSNQRRTVAGPAMIAWEDDRGGDLDIVGRNSVGEFPNERVLPLGPTGTNQSRPALGPDGYLAWQDDRNGTAAVWSTRTISIEPIRLSPDDGRPHVLPSVSGRFVTWEVMDPVNASNVVVLERATGVLRELHIPGDQHGGRAVDGVVYYTDQSEDGVRLMAYDWNADSTEVVARDASGPAVDPTGSGRLAWVSSDAGAGGPPITGVRAGKPGTGGELLSDPSRSRPPLLQGTAALGGVGILMDDAGDDTYESGMFSQGAVFTFPRAPDPISLERGKDVASPAGALLDMDGNDRYRAAATSQGSHWTWDDGYGPVSPSNVQAGDALLLDLRGSDHYDAVWGSQGAAGMVAVAAAEFTGSVADIVGVPTGWVMNPPLRTNAFLVHSSGLLVDLDGLDTYSLPHDLVLGSGPGALDVNGHTAASACGDVVEATVPGVTQPVDGAVFNDDGIRGQVGNTSDDTRTAWNQTKEQGNWNDTRDDWNDTKDGQAATEECENVEQAYEEQCESATGIAIGAEEDILRPALAGLLGDLPVGSVADASTSHCAASEAAPGNQEIWSRLVTEGEAESERPPYIRPLSTPGAPPLCSMCPYGILVGGVGVDYALVAQFDALLREAAEGLFEVEVDAPAAAGGVIEGDALLQAQARSHAALDGLEVKRIEFYIEDALFASMDPTPCTQGLCADTVWDTDSGAVEDGDYQVEARAHFGPTFAASSLGYVREVREFKVDNIPRFESASLVNGSFSPYPFAQDASGHPLLSYLISTDPDVQDAFVQIDILNETGAVVREIQDATVAGSVSGPQTITWDGLLLSPSGDPVPTGDYTLRVAATDKIGNLSRTVNRTFLLHVDADPPRDGCIYLEDIPVCNPDINISLGLSAVTANPNAAGGALVDLEFRTTDGEVPHRVHLYERRNATVPWELVEETQSEVFTYLLPELTSRDLVVLFEDTTGNLECSTTCTDRVDDTVERGDPDLLGTALGNKAGTPSGVATFREDTIQPVLEPIGVEIDGKNRSFSAPLRAGSETPLAVWFTVDEQHSRPVKAVVSLQSEADVNHSLRDEFIADGGASGNFSYEMVPSAESVGLDEYRFRWTGWQETVADWEEGGVLLNVQAFDAAGNPPLTSLASRITLDRTPPAVLESHVVYPPLVAGDPHAGSKGYAVEGETVVVRLDLEDNTINGRTFEDRDLSATLNATAVGGSVVPLNHTSGSGLHEGTIQIGAVGATNQVVSLPLQVRDPAGNEATIPLDVVVGAPGLNISSDPIDANETSAWINWTVSPPGTATLVVWEEGREQETKQNIEGKGVLRFHNFHVSGLTPGVEYAGYLQVQNSLGAVQRSHVVEFTTAVGLVIDVLSPQNGTHLAGLSPIEVKTQVAATDDEPLVRLTILDDEGNSTLISETTPIGGELAMDLVTESFPDGTYELEVVASILGESSVHRVTGLLIDNSPPDVEITRPRPDSLLPGVPASLAARVTDPFGAVDGAAFSLRVDGREAPANFTVQWNGSEALVEVTDIPDLPPGPVRLEVVAHDLAGNIASDAVRILHDPDAPEVVDARAVGSGSIRPGQALEVFVHAEDAVGIDSVFVDGASIGGNLTQLRPQDKAGRFQGPVDVPASTPEGAILLPVVVRDLAGHETTVQVAAQIDATPPQVEWVLRAAGPSTAEVEADSAEPLELTVEFRTAEKTLTGQAEGEAPVAVVDGLEPGRLYEVNLTARDVAGNTAEDTREWRFAPVVVEPPQVVDLRASVRPDGAVHLAWSLARTVDDDAIRFQVIREQGGETQQITEVPTRSHVDRGAPPGTSVEYVVRSVNLAGEPGPLSGPVEVTVPRVVVFDSPAVTPMTGTQHTRFDFRLALSSAQDTDPKVFLVVDGKAHLMQKDGSSADCTQECVFTLGLNLQPRTLTRPTVDYHVEILDAGRMIQVLPDEDGPTVVHSGQSADDPSWDAPAPVIPVSVVILAALAAAVRRRWGA